MNLFISFHFNFKIFKYIIKLKCCILILLNGPELTDYCNKYAINCPLMHQLIMGQNENILMVLNPILQDFLPIHH